MALVTAQLGGAFAVIVKVLATPSGSGDAGLVRCTRLGSEL